MPISFKIAEHDARPVTLGGYGTCKDTDALLASTWGNRASINRYEELLQSSFSGSNFSDLGPQNNGFVDTVIHAYNQHHHLVLRPDDVWIAILGQFNFYVNANAEKLRSKFVAHEGKKKLIVRAVGTRYTVNFGDLAHQMTSLIHNNVVDKDLKDWILPDFTTTSFNDTVVCAVLMMATLKAYFSYGFALCCGIPSVTLEGEKEDWVKLLTRLDKMESFGYEPKAWAALLRPVLQRFVAAFDGEPDIEFWGKVCHLEDGGSGPASISGWITAFCVWDSEGKWQGPNISDMRNVPPPGSPEYYRLVLDGVQYAILDDNAIPVGFCEVDVDLNDNGEHFDCMMVSGHMAARLQGPKRDTLSPSPGWFMFIKHEHPESAPAPSDRSPLSISDPLSMRYPILPRWMSMTKPITTVEKSKEMPKKQPSKECFLKRWRSTINHQLGAIFRRTVAAPK